MTPYLVEPGAAKLHGCEAACAGATTGLQSVPLAAPWLGTPAALYGRGPAAASRAEPGQSASRLRVLAFKCLIGQQTSFKCLGGQQPCPYSPYR